MQLELPKLGLRDPEPGWHLRLPCWLKFSQEVLESATAELCRLGKGGGYLCYAGYAIWAPQIFARVAQSGSHSQKYEQETGEMCVHCARS